MRRIKNIFLMIFAVICLFAVASCGKSADYTIGILQYATHDALDYATQGFKEKVNELIPEGKTVKFIVKNPEGDQASMTTMASSLVRKCDLVLGNATPAATALKAASITEGKTDLPILFTSVSDPVDAKLVASLSNPGGNITGTSDINPIEQQVDLMLDLKGNDCKIGFLYSADEPNSEVQCNEAKAYLTSKGFKSNNIVTKTVQDNNSITPMATALCSGSDKVDIIYIPTDNRLASNVSQVTNTTTPAKVPVICGEGSMVKNGGTLSLSISYIELGKTTGEMAAEILFEGKAPSSIPVEAQTDVSKFEFTINNEALTAMSITLSDEFKAKYNIQ